MLVERTALPALLLELEERLVAVLREVVLPAVLRFTLGPRLVAEPVLRVRSVWSTVPAERAVEEPAVLRLVEEPVLRLVRSLWLTVPAERVVVEPALRLVVAEEELPAERLVVLLPVERLVDPVLRLVRSFCAKEERLEEALAEGAAERPEDIEPDERLLIEEEPRVVVWEEDDRAAEDPPERRDWASASGAATITKVRAIAAKVLIILFMALSF